MVQVSLEKVVSDSADRSDDGKERQRERLDVWRYYIYMYILNMPVYGNDGTHLSTEECIATIV